MSDTHPYLAIKDPAELHAAVDRASRENPDTIAFLDQWDAILRNTLARAGKNAQVMALAVDPTIQDLIRYALERRAGEHVETVAPVVRFEPTGMCVASHEHERHGDRPITDRYPVVYCNLCGQAVAGMAATPFWYPAGRVIVQIDMCGDCADDYIFNRGHVPQIERVA